jgi:SAM-dependent methyltransferase
MSGLNRVNVPTALAEKLRLFQYFFSSLRKRGIWRTFKISLFEVFYEYRLSADTAYVIPRQILDGDKEALAHATDYFPSSYLVLHEAFSCIRDECRDSVLVDYGCGMGRALMFASTLPLKKIIGVEVSSSLCTAARKNLERLYRSSRQVKPAWSIVHADARAFTVPEDANLFYFFNPFDAELLDNVIGNILTSARKTPRKCTVLYANPQHESVFLSRGFSKQPTPSKDFSKFTLLTGQSATGSA